MPKLTDLLVLDDSCPYLKCPFPGCEGIPHITGTLLGRNKSSTSGPGLTIQFHCEWEHQFKLVLTDHSGSTWLNLILMDEKYDYPGRQE